MALITSRAPSTTTARYDAEPGVVLLGVLPAEHSSALAHSARRRDRQDRGIREAAWHPLS